MNTNCHIVKKGLDIPLPGRAVRVVADLRNETRYAVKPTDYVGLVPRLLVGEGDSVACGDALFCDKHDERVRYTSPVAGVVRAVVRGERRSLQAVVIERDDDTPAQINVDDTPTRSALVAAMLRCGLWTALRQRPFGTVPSPDGRPRDIFVSCFDTAPLAPDFDYVMRGREEAFLKGLEALALLTDGRLYLSLHDDDAVSPRLEWLHKGLVRLAPKVEAHYFKGPHPAGNIGTQIAAIHPIDKGDTVWTMGVQDIATLGLALLTGRYQPERVVAFAGPVARHPQYYRVRPGVCVKALAERQLGNADYPSPSVRNNVRLVSGNILAGSRISHDGYLGATDTMLTVIEEGNQFDFMGWLMPGLRKYSFSRTFLSGVLHNVQDAASHCRLPLPRLPERLFCFSTNLHGGVRPLVFTGSFERVFPFDIYPMQLLKAAIVDDVELMEQLGIYEVEPEDFALCEFIDPSKTEIQTIIRDALERIRKEGGQ